MRADGSVELQQRYVYSADQGQPGIAAVSVNQRVPPAFSPYRVHRGAVAWTPTGVLAHAPYKQHKFRKPEFLCFWVC